MQKKMAEKVGFEPTVPFSITGFQDRLLKPLGHLSVTLRIIYHKKISVKYKLTACNI